MNKSDIIKQHLKDFRHLGTNTIAKIILHNYGANFDGDLEKIRHRLRYYRGADGKYNRNGAVEIIPREETAMPETQRIKRSPYCLPVGLWLIVSDVHVPFHESLPIEAMLSCAKPQKINGVLYNGDLQDCAAISFWPSLQKRDFDSETVAVIRFLDYMRYEFPDAKFVYKPGNHEYRLPRLIEKYPALTGIPLAVLETRLGLEEREIELLDYKQIVMAGKLPILHGDEFRTLSRAVNPARGLFLKAKSWAACSHCHTTSQHTATDIKGDMLTTWSFGCLCNLSPDYNPYANDWNWGFALINVEKNGDFEVENRRILPSGQVV